MTSLLVDTNTYTAFWEDDPKIAAVFELAETLVFPFITVGELLAGFRLGNRENENRNRMNDLLISRHTEILYADRNTPEFYATIFSELRRKGRPIPTNDIWIAALARQHDMPVCSLDTHFKFVDGLKLVTDATDLGG